MNPQIEAYLAEARAAGKSDAIIQQELRAAGWPEADISQIFGAAASTASVAGNVAAGIAVKTAGWFSAKTIAIIIGSLVIVGGGSYYAFVAKKQAVPSGQNQIDLTTQMSNQQGGQDILAGFHHDLKLPSAQQTMKVNNSDIAGNHNVNVVEIGLTADQAISFFKSDLGGKGWIVGTDEITNTNQVSGGLKHLIMTKATYQLEFIIMDAGTGVNISISQTSVATPNQPTDAQQQDQTTVAHQFHCPDIFTDADLQTVMGKSSSGAVLSEGALLSDQLACSYKGADNKQVFRFYVEWATNPMLKDIVAKFAYDKQGWSAIDHKQFDQEYLGILSGVGSDAITELAGIEALSSNKKYIIHTMAPVLITMTGSSDYYGQEVQAAKLIDAHLSKY